MALTAASPSVSFTEKDYSLVTSTESDWIGATVGVANWGPINQPTLVTEGETGLVASFGKPTDATYLPFFAAADFLGYSDKLYFVRAASNTAKNAVAVGQTPVLIRNDDEFDNATLNGHQFIAKYASSLANGLTIDVADATKYVGWEYASSFDTVPGSGEFHVAVIDPNGSFDGLINARKQVDKLYLSGTPTIGTFQTETITLTGDVGTDQSFTIDGVQVNLLVADDLASTTTKVVNALANSGKYTSVTSSVAGTVTVVRGERGAKTVMAVSGETDPTLTVSVAVTTAGTDTTVFTVPGTTISYTATIGDTLKVITTALAAATTAKIVADDASVSMYETAVASGNSIILTHKTVGKKALGLVVDGSDDGVTFKSAIFEVGTLGDIIEKFELLTNVTTSKDAFNETLYWKDRINKQSRFVRACDSSIQLTASTIVLQGGNSGTSVTSYAAAIDYLSNAESVDFNYMIAGHLSDDDQRIAADMVETRRDSMLFISPSFNDVVNVASPLENVKSWREDRFGRSSSYVVLDCNWAQVYDKYNDKNRWIPCASGTAGLVARVARLQNPWVSPAGYANGIYRNFLKLAWSPNKAQRDELFKRGINPVIASPGDGFVLLGDKTALNRKSAFDQIHVRTLFLYMERQITVLAKAYLFSVNDVYTRASFTSAIEPFMRLIQGARGMEAFKVVIDERNNGAAVREQNLMQGLIAVKPLYSTRYINLTFAAVKPTVSFEEVEQAEGL